MSESKMKIKKQKWFLILIVSISFYSPQVFAEPQWTFFKEQKCCKYYYQKIAHDKKTGIVKIKVRSDNKDGSGYTITESRINCFENLRNGDIYWEYDAKGKLIKQGDLSGKWFPLGDRMTVYDDLKDKVCK
jgi:hypothetical protein